MNYTEKYHLPQWAKSDRIMMDDFNDAMSRLEAGLAEAKELAAEAKSVAESAKGTADSTYFVIGAYTGTGGDVRNPLEIDVGFRPRFVIVSAHSWGPNVNDASPNQFGLLTDRGNAGFGEMTDTGFRVWYMSVYPIPYVNVQGVPYRYIAFK